METEKDLIYWVPSFYVLEDLLVRFKPSEGAPSRIKLKHDLCEVRGSYSRVLASLLFDVLVRMCFGEARHACDRCGVVIPELSYVMDRKSAYRLAEQFDPKTSLPKLRDLFLECWTEPYGGSAWAIIAEAAMKYWSLPSGIFIDHCVDLSHHGGLAFDKLETGFHVWHKRKYLDILDQKKNGSILDIDMPLPVFYFVEALLFRARTLRLVEALPELVISKGYGYRAVQWGSEIPGDPRTLCDEDSPGDFSERGKEKDIYGAR